MGTNSFFHHEGHKDSEEFFPFLRMLRESRNRAGGEIMTFEKGRFHGR
jgi:hypothetical protein